MTDESTSSTSHESGTSAESRESPLQKGYGIPRRGYTPLTGQILPVAPSTSTGESGSVAPAAPQATPSDES
jgi:hypothetical protein